MNNEILHWDDAYLIGHNEVDSEHRGIFELLKKIHSCGDDLAKTLDVVKEIIKHTKIHFINEENFMKSINYKDIDSHKSLHKDIADKLNTIIKNIKTMSLEEVVMSIDDFIYKTILPHILLEDKKVHHLIKSRDELKGSFNWKDDYKLSNDLIDSEHMQLFEIAIKALEHDGKDTRGHVKETILELFDYMKTHFEHEETYMNEINYPDVQSHCKIHKDVISQLNDFIKTLPNLKIEEFDKKLIEFMDINLINHILYEDKKIVNYLKNK